MKRTPCTAANPGRSRPFLGGLPLAADQACTKSAKKGRLRPGLAAVQILLLAATCFAQPVITDLQPRGAQKGRPFTLTVLGRDLTEGARIESTLPATFTALGPEKGAMGGATFLVEPTGRSEERRVGKECRSRWSPYH